MSSLQSTFSKLLLCFVLLMYLNVWAFKLFNYLYPQGPIRSAVSYYPQFSYSIIVAGYFCAHKLSHIKNFTSLLCFDLVL